MKLDLLCAKFAIKYAQDTMKVPPHPEVKEKPVIVEEVIPPPPRVPSFDEPSYVKNTFHPTQPDMSARQAFTIIFFECLKIFSDTEVEIMREMDPSSLESFNELRAMLRRKMQTTQNVLQKADQLNSRIFK